MRVRIVTDQWTASTGSCPGVSMGRWVVMPDHFQAIIFLNRQGAIGAQPDGVGEIIRRFKAVSARRIWATLCPDFGWQRGYHDRLIRSWRQLETIRDYIGRNPAEWNPSQGIGCRSCHTRCRRHSAVSL